MKVVRPTGTPTASLEMSIHAAGFYRILLYSAADWSVLEDVPDGFSAYMEEMKMYAVFQEVQDPSTPLMDLYRPHEARRRRRTRQTTA